VVAEVTAPSGIFSIGPIGAGGIATANGVAVLGKFTVTFPNGFPSEGQYSLKVNVYAGPTIEVSAGPITSVSYSIPPFPAIASTTKQTFSVSGSGPTSSGSWNISQPASVQVGVGNTVTLNVPVTSYYTMSQQITVAVDIYDGSPVGIAGMGTLLQTVTSQPVTVPANGNVTVPVQYTVTSVSSGNTNRNLGCRIVINGQTVYTNTFHGVLTVTGAPTSQATATATYDSTLGYNRVSYSFAGFQPLATISATLQGTVQDTTTADGSGDGSSWFRNTLSAGTYTLTVSDNYGHSAAAQFIVGTPAVTNPTVTASYNVPPLIGGISSTDYVTYQLLGFTPYAVVTVAVEGVPCDTEQVDSTGAHSGQFRWTGSPGTYSVTAYDNQGDVAATTFIVSGTAPSGGPTATAKYDGTGVDFSFKGLSPNSTVVVTVNETDNYTVVTADSSGSGSGTISGTMTHGSYTLTVVDWSDNSATIGFTV
jgi:hypothetical protein